jgi:hypothetical protein
VPDAQVHANAVERQKQREAWQCFFESEVHSFTDPWRFQPTSWLESKSAITSANALLIPIPNRTSKGSLSRTVRVITKPQAELTNA